MEMFHSEAINNFKSFFNFNDIHRYCSIIAFKVLP